MSRLFRIHCRTCQKFPPGRTDHCGGRLRQSCGPGAWQCARGSVPGVDRRNKSGSPQETRGRIYVVDLANKQSQLVWDQPRAVQVVDHDVASGRTLIVDNLDQFQRGGELVMVEGIASGNPRTLYRRTLPGRGSPVSRCKWSGAA